MINPTDLAADSADVEQDAQDFFSLDLDDSVTAVLILGQLDPTEIDYAKSEPRWNDSQRDLILKAGGILAAWREEGE